MELIPYLYFDGCCEEAFRYYEKHLGGTIVAMITHADTPPEVQVSPDWKEKIMHARLDVGDATLFASDDPTGAYEAPKGTRVCIQQSDVARAERIFAALADGGEVSMPLQETFWAARFGMLTDRFGTRWLINCEATA
jgi:PhnB protein